MANAMGVFSNRPYEGKATVSLTHLHWHQTQIEIVLLLASGNNASARIQPSGACIRIIAADRWFAGSEQTPNNPTHGRPFWNPLASVFSGSPLIMFFHPKSFPLGSRAVWTNQEWLITLVDASYVLTGEPVKCPRVIAQVIWCHSFSNFYKCLHARPRSCFCFWRYAK